MTPSEIYSKIQELFLDKNGDITSRKVNIVKERNHLLYSEILKSLNQIYPGLSLPQAHRLLKNQIYYPLTCLNCQKIILNDNRGNSGNYGFSYYCSTECGNSSSKRTDKIRETKIQKYGGNGFEVDSHRVKACATMREKYGQDYYVLTDEFKEKVRQTSLNKYNTSHPFQSRLAQDRYKQTMMSRYNISNSLVAGSKFREKALRTTEVRFGSRQIMRTSYMRVKSESTGKRIPNYLQKDFELYHMAVSKFTNQALTDGVIHNLNQRGRLDLNPQAWHLDHIVSIFVGFKNNVPAHIIGSACNLRMIPARQNCSKGARCDIQVEHLLDLYFESLNKTKVTR